MWSSYLYLLHLCISIKRDLCDMTHFFGESEQFFGKANMWLKNSWLLRNTMVIRKMHSTQNIIIWTVLFLLLIAFVFIVTSRKYWNVVNKLTLANALMRMSDTYYLLIEEPVRTELAVINIHPNSTEFDGLQWQ